MTRLLGIAFGICFAGVAGAELPGIRRLDGSSISFAEAETFARDVLRENGVTGAQIAVIDRGRVVWKRAFGYRRLDPQLPMETNTNIWAASITKSVFATYVVDHGGISLDVPVAQQLERPLDSFEPYKETAADLVRDSRWPRVTPRMLLAHSAGLANFAFLEPDKKMHLHFEPGTSYRYSGEGINLVQFLVERKKGRPLDALMQEAVFGPLGMKSTGMIYRQEFAANVADRYGADGKFIAQTKRFPARGAGSMTTTVEDLGRFVEALLARLSQLGATDASKCF
ncbi:MAG: serine hydrolase domain-containing protein [Bryobacteraceae bacterium]